MRDGLECQACSLHCVIWVIRLYISRRTYHDQSCAPGQPLWQLVLGVGWRGRAWGREPRRKMVTTHETRSPKSRCWQHSLRRFEGNPNPSVASSAGHRFSLNWALRPSLCLLLPVAFSFLWSLLCVSFIRTFVIGFRVHPRSQHLEVNYI